MRFLVFSIVFLHAILSYSQVDLIKGLKGKYCLDGDGFDQSSNQNHGQIIRASFTPDRFGKPNSALLLTGDSSFLKLLPNGIFNYNYSYSFWFKLNEPVPNGIYKCLVNIGGIECSQNVGVANKYFNTLTGIISGSYYNPNSSVAVTSNEIPPLYQWNHVVVTRSNNELKLYVNGILRSTNSIPPGPCYQQNQQEGRLGGRQGHPTQYFKGAMDDFWIFDRAISQEEVLAIYNYDGVFQAIDVKDTFICGNTPTTLEYPDTNATFIWSTGQTTRSINVSEPGIYWVDVNKQCVFSRDTIIVTRKGDGILPSQYTLCGDDPVELEVNVTNGKVERWSTSANDTNSKITVDQTGLYWVRIIKDNCSYQINTVVNNSFNKPNLGPDLQICPNQNILLQSNLFTGNHQWSNGATGLTNNINQSGTYILSVTLNNCTQFDTINVIDAPTRSYVLPKDTLLCGPNSIISALNPGTTAYAWSDGITTPDRIINSPGKYYVQSSFSTCFYTDSIEVDFKEKYSFEIFDDTLVCNGTNILLNIPNIASIKWENGDTARNRNLNKDTIYIFEIVEGGCNFKDTLEVNYYPEIDVPDNVDVTLCYSQSFDANFDLNDPYTTYLWENGETNPILNFTEPINTRISIINPCGNFDRDVSLKFEDCTGFFPPSSFTPNGDGKNDLFSIKLVGAKNFEILIFNRWGEIIFSSKNPDFKWDGKYQDKLVPNGIYFITLRYIDALGVIRSYRGNLYIN